MTRIATEVTRELHKQGHKVVQIPTNGDSLYAYAYKTTIEAAFTVPRKGVDVYHALATMEAMWLPKNKSIATFLDLFTTTNPDLAGAGMGYSWWKREVGRRYFAAGSKIAARCRYLVCISEKTKQDVLKYVCDDESKVSVIRLGIREDLLPIPRAPNRRLRIGTLGQMDKRKRIDLLVQQFRASKLNADLEIAGQGPDRALLEKQADGDSRISFLGLVPDEKLAAWYNSLDLFVFPTAIEGYGLPPVEAMACGVPVVVMADSIIPSDVRDRCLPVRDLTLFFNSPGAMDVAFRTADYSNQQFGAEHRWSTCVAQYLKLYENIVKGE